MMVKNRMTIKDWTNKKKKILLPRISFSEKHKKLESLEIGQEKNLLQFFVMRNNFSLIYWLKLQD